jgi:hypothetical protein
MILRCGSFFLLIYTYWNRNSYEFISHNSILTTIIEIVKYMPSLFLVGMAILFIMSYYRYTLLFDIIAWIIIIIIVIININILLLNDSTDLVYFHVNHPMLDGQKLKYFESYLQENSNKYVMTLTISEKQYYDSQILKLCSKINSSELIKLDRAQIEVYCDDLIKKAAYNTSYQHNNITYITFTIALIIATPILYSLCDF